MENELLLIFEKITAFIRMDIPFDMNENEKNISD